jgi:hypothetical protein
MNDVICSAKINEKSVNFTNDPVERPDIWFLDEDGKLVQEEFILSPFNHYVSKEFDWKRYGKVEVFLNKTIYSLKTFKNGRVGEVLPDRWGALSQTNDLSTFSDRKGSRSAEYQQVSERLFQTYQTYQKTRNPIYFRQVERDILNGDRLS